MSYTYKPSPVRAHIWRTERLRAAAGRWIVQGEIDYDPETGFWSAWFFNWTNPDLNAFRLNFRSRAAAVRWVNATLRGLPYRVPEN